MTRPIETEADIRAAYDEAGVNPEMRELKILFALARRIAAEREAVLVRADVLAFLHGEGPLDGRHFGDSDGDDGA
jgi:hypothetical protein